MMKNTALFKPTGRGKRILYLALSGILTGLCVAFSTVIGGIAEWFTLIPAALVMYSLSDEDRRKIADKSGKSKRGGGILAVYGMGFFFFMAEYVPIYHWFFSMYPLDFTGMSRGYAAAVVLIGCFGMSFLAAGAGGLFFLLTVLTGKLPVMKKHTYLRAVAGAAAYSVFEWTMTHGWTGVPWGRLALGQMATNFTPTVQTASLFGSYFVTFIIVLFAFLVADGLYSGKLKLRAAVALTLALLNFAVGTVMYFVPTDAEGTLTVAAVQGNVSSRDKWDGDSSKTSLERYSAYTADAAKAGADVVLWPETAFPFTVTEGSIYDGKFETLAKENNVTVLVGCLGDGGGDLYQNVIRAYYPDGSEGEGERKEKEEYAKRRLVPFGEYLPWRTFFETLVPPLTELAMLQEDLDPGTAPDLITVDTRDGSEVKCGVLICFDSIYEELARESVKNGAQILLLSTNDSWFGDSRAVWMHNDQARLRSIENRRWTVRAANTGVSSVIDEKGRVLAQLPPLEEGSLTQTAGTIRNTAPYTVTGNLWVWLCIAFLCLIPIPDALLSAHKSSRREK